MLITSTNRKRFADLACKLVWETLTGRKYRRFHTEPTYLHLTPGAEMEQRLRSGEMTATDWHQLHADKPGRPHLFSQGWLKQMIRIPFGMEIAWEGYGVNALVNDGEQYMIKALFTGESPTPPSNFYFALSTQNESTMGELVTSGSATSNFFTEVTGSNYARIAVARGGAGADWTTSIPAGDWQALSVAKVFAASGSWTAALALVLADGSAAPSQTNATTTRVIATSDLSTSRTLVNGDTLTVTMKVTQS